MDTHLILRMSYDIERTHPMTKNMSLTRAEALKKVELFEELFTVVRILDAQSMEDIKKALLSESTLYFV